MTDDLILYFIIASGVIGVVYGLVTAAMVLSLDAGSQKMQEIARAIQEGASSFLNRQYSTIALVGIVIFFFVWLFLGLWSALGFLTGATLSGLAGYIGMLISVRANVRTTFAASKSLEKGLSVAFRSGAVTGMLVAGLALLSISVYYAILILALDFAPSDRVVIDSLVALGFGASLISIFARLGGGIFTKGADVGGDLVGKLEAGIPEDDPRNAATIADNVGDNVGDCAGMAADLFETYAVTAVATMVLASIFFQGEHMTSLMLYPLVIGAICLLTSIIGTFFVRLGKSQSIMGALYKGFIATAILAVPVIYFVTSQMIGFSTILTTGEETMSGSGLFWSAMIGLGVTGLLIVITEYYTGTNYRPVRDVAQASVGGHGINVIQGLAVSLEATAAPALVIVAGIISTYFFAGIFGTAIAVTSMLALAGMVVALDAFGPVTDNAGGIAEMSKLPAKVRKTTDALDAVGNTTKAVTKGYAIGSAGLGALVLFALYTQDLKYFASQSLQYSYFAGINPDFSLANPYIVAGLFVGAAIPYLFGALAMKAVGRASGSIVEEVRRQFKENPGIMKGTTKPDYSRAVDILTRAAIFEMIIPSLLPVLTPLALFVVTLWVAGKSAAFAALGAMLMGVIITGLFVAISMTAGGGAWDNAKKYIEDGNHGGKGSDAHKAAVTGDTVGDPYKDTAGPAINPMIKITNIVALLLLASLAHS